MMIANPLSVTLHGANAMLPKLYNEQYELSPASNAPHPEGGAAQRERMREQDRHIGQCDERCREELELLRQIRIRSGVGSQVHS